LHSQWFYGYYLCGYAVELGRRLRGDVAGSRQWGVIAGLEGIGSGTRVCVQVCGVGET
jgi:hypothetical protein